jgi:hypothetical protein
MSHCVDGFGGGPCLDLLGPHRRRNHAPAAARELKRAACLAQLQLQHHAASAAAAGLALALVAS